MRSVRAARRYESDCVHEGDDHRRSNADRVPYSDDFCDLVIALANTPVRVSRPGERRRTLSLFEVMVRRLATGQASRRISPMPFIQLAIACAGRRADLPHESSSTYDNAAAAPRRARSFESALITDSDADIERAISSVHGITGGLARYEDD